MRCPVAGPRSGVVGARIHELHREARAAGVDPEEVDGFRDHAAEVHRFDGGADLPDRNLPNVATSWWRERWWSSRSAASAASSMARLCPRRHRPP